MSSPGNERLVQGRLNVGGNVGEWCSLEQLEKLNLWVQAGRRLVSPLLGLLADLRFQVPFDGPGGGAPFKLLAEELAVGIGVVVSRKMSADSKSTPVDLIWRSHCIGGILEPVSADTL